MPMCDRSSDVCSSDLNCQHPLDHQKAREFQKNIYFCFIDYANAFNCVDQKKKLRKILKDDAVKVLHSKCQQTWKTQQWPQNWKRSVFIPIPKKGNAKECSIYRTIALISHTSKEQYVNRELPHVQDGFRKCRGTRDQIAKVH